MRLTVIGCSPAWPNPGGAHSGYLVDEAGRRVLLDCGPGVLSRLRSASLLPVDAIAITHLHLDHWGDLVPWVWMTEHDGMPSSRDRVALWLPPGGRGNLDAFAERFGKSGMFDGTFALREYENETPFTVSGFEILPREVEHYGASAFAFRVRSSRSGAILAYSGDTAPCPGVRATAAGADLFLCEATLANAEADATPRGHLSEEEAVGIADGPLLITHRPLDLPPSVAEIAVEGWIGEVEPRAATTGGSEVPPSSSGAGS